MKTHFVMMASYNAWANVRLFRMAGALADELYRKEVGASFKSHHSTLNHLAPAILTVLGVTEPDPLDLLIMQREQAWARFPSPHPRTPTHRFPAGTAQPWRARRSRST
jgi:uncharacterized damage-inducible protein DinB